MGGRSRRVLALVLAATLHGILPAAGQRLPLPPLTLERLPVGVREDFEAAYADARARPGEADAVGRLGMMLHAYEQYVAAGICYRRARDLEPDEASWAYLSGLVQAAAGSHAAAVRAFGRALEIEPRDLPTRLHLADTLVALADFEAARRQYDALAREFPELALVHFGLGRIASATGQPDRAVEHYRTAVERAPAFGAAHYALALAYRAAGRADRATPHLEAYGRFGPSRPPIADPRLDEIRTMRSTARDLIERGAKLGAAGRLDESIAAHVEALDRDPGAVQAHVNLIVLYGRTGRVDQAEAHYRAALASEPTPADAHYNYGVLLAAGRRYAEAAAAFGRALDVNPFHAPAHNNLGTLLAGRGDLEQAIEHYRQALANDPLHRGARFNLGRALVALGRPRDAIEQIEKILQPEGPETPRYLQALANAYHAAGDLAAARGSLERARAAAAASGQQQLAAAIDAQLERLGADPP